MNEELKIPSSIPSGKNEVEALQEVIKVLHPLEGEVRQRILKSVATFLQIGHDVRPVSNETFSRPIKSTQPFEAPFSADTSQSPKDFLLEKQPRTDVERIACLAYYLTHYRDTPHFKTIDLSVLNTEAAQPKFTNAAYASNNAVKMGYLAPSTKGQRQLSAVGERFVLALPDRDAARDALSTYRRKPRANKTRRAKAKI